MALGQVNKILISAENYYPRHGGIEQYLRTLCRYLTSQGIQVDLVTQPYAGEPEETKFEECHVFRKDFLSGSLKDPFSVVGKADEIAQFIKSGDYDLVFANNHNSLALIKAAKNANVPVIYGCHGVGLMCPLKKRFLRDNETLCWKGPSYLNCSACYMQAEDEAPLKVRLQTLRREVWPRITKYLDGIDVLNSADARIANSELCASLFSKRSGTFGLALPLDFAEREDTYYPVDSSEFCQRFGLEKKNFIVVSSRLHMIKGQEYVVEAMTHLDPSIKLLIVGNDSLFSGSADSLGTYGEKIKKFILENNLQDRVVFAGRLDIAELRQAYSAARICVMPSVWIETFGYVAIEAMACGTPSIVTGNSGAAECITSQVGVVVPRQDADAIAQAVQKIWPKAIEMGNKARKHIRKTQDIDVIGKKTLKIFESVV